MRVHTNAGQIELTAEMARPGMVFLYEPSGQRITTVRPYAERPGTLACHPDAWECNPGGILFIVDLGIDVTVWRLLGCDPTIATRPDCERYGIAPGIDAAAHGFARLRGGGAVDLTEPRSHVPGMVFNATACEGGRTTILRDFGDDWWESTSGTDWHLWKAVRDKEVRFIGLDARHARPGNERLCCGAWGDGWTRCTLAIGHDDQHEDLATGVRWGAEPVIQNIDGPLSFGRVEPHPEKADCRPVAGPRTRPDGSGVPEGRPSGPCPGCGGTIICACQPWAPLTGDPVSDIRGTLTFRRAPEPENHPVRFVFCGQDGDDLVDLARIEPDGSFVCHCGSVNPAVHFETCKLEWQYRMAATWAVDYTNARGEGLSRVVQEGLLGACAVALLAWCCRLWDERHEDRRAREAPLVALVNACPEGLDPRGWQAAVLAIEERRRVTWVLMHETTARLVEELRIAEVLRRDEMFDGEDGFVQRDALAAYHRALQPAPRVEPFRRRAPGLPCDDGRDG